MLLSVVKVWLLICIFKWLIKMYMCPHIYYIYFWFSLCKMSGFKALCHWTVEEITWCFFLSHFIILFVCCSEIGTALQHSYFGPGSGLFHYARLGCRGDEKSLLECRSRKFVTSDCNHGNEAGVLCAPPEGQCSFCGSEANNLLSDKCCKHSCI